MKPLIFVEGEETFCYRINAPASTSLISEFYNFQEVSQLDFKGSLHSKSP